MLPVHSVPEHDQGVSFDDLMVISTIQEVIRGIQVAIGKEKCVEAARALGRLPFIVKPNQGGSGARMYKVESADEVATILDGDASLWEPEDTFWRDRS